MSDDGDALAEAQRRLRRGDADAAQRICDAALAGDPEQEALWIVLIETWLARGAPDRAQEAAERGLKAIAGSERLTAQLAFCRLHQGDFTGAQTLADALWRRGGSDVHALTLLGRVWAAIELHEQARAAFERALALSPDDPQLLFNLATSLRNFGEFARAEALYDEVIRRRPSDWEACKNRSELRRQTPQSNHVHELEVALGRTGADWRGTVMLHYAIGKEQEDLGDAEAAFRAYDAGARLRRKHMTYDVETDLARMRSLMSTFGADWLAAQAPGHPTREPIFVFGLPRSGSTLLERMLGAHSQVLAAGELQNFGVATTRLQLERTSGRRSDPVEGAARLHPHALGQAYLASTRPRTGQTPHFIDKLPSNFLYAGLIAAALPNAAMIHIRRDPRDAGFGMYKTLFKQAYPFSYDLDELGRYIRAYQDLMDHWRATMPGRLIEVGYERLVRDPASVIGEVLERCGLAFEERCLRSHENQDTSSTASAVQVRRPIYRTSIDTWRHFERQLAPLVRHLEPIL